jgi:hypothetical protein
MTTYHHWPLKDEHPPQSFRIRELNDAVRTADTAIGALLANGQLVITRGVAAARQLLH